MTFLGIFPREVKILFLHGGEAHKVRLNPQELRLKQASETESGGGGGRLKQTLENSENQNLGGGGY